MLRKNAHRFAKISLCLKGIGVFLAVASPATASPRLGYLPWIGPAPLRFLAVVIPSTNIVVLPTSAPPIEPEPIHVQMAKAGLFGPPMPTPEQLMEARSSDAGTALPPGLTDSTADQVPPDVVISPQMLLKYFNRNTNGSATVVAPVNFNPPKAPVHAPQTSPTSSPNH